MNCEIYSVELVRNELATFYVVEGEKHFYATQEVIDMVNLLRAIENPYDRLALAGVLRSPLGGLNDRELYELHQQGLLDYRAVARPKGLPKNGPASQVRDLYSIVLRLHKETRRLSVGDAVREIFDSLPVMVLAAILMNFYPIRYIHLGHVAGRHPALFWGWMGLLIVVMFTPYFGAMILLGSILYLISPFYTGRIDPSVAQLEHRVPRLR
ncbi:MAG: hypothetical protein IIA14_06210 [SAR324 cluster bacterium]|nr:hypothetical protein [SAR324 cluster bacterium]